MSRYFTKTLAALEPYTPGEQLKLPDLVKLNANENPYPPAPGVAAAVAVADTDNSTPLIPNPSFTTPHSRLL